MKRRYGIGGAIHCLIAAIVAGPLSFAEVGVPFGPPGTGGGGAGILESIIGDDPDPFGRIWIRFSPPTSGSIPLNPLGTSNGDGYPSSIVHPVTGEPIVAWARNSVSGYDIVVSRFANGAWTEPAIVADSTGDALDPSLAVAADGTVHLVYWADGADRSVWHVESPASLASWSAPARVSAPDTPASRPHAVFHQGLLRVAYESHPFGYGSTPKAIVLSHRDGASFVTDIVALTAYSGRGEARVGSHSGRLWVEWVDAVTATGAGDVAWVRFGAGGWEATRYVSFVDAFDREFHVRPGIRSLVMGP